jgi:phage terminase large subunit-like protein
MVLQKQAALRPAKQSGSRPAAHSEEQLRILAAAQLRLEKLLMQDVFDPNLPGSTPTEAQAKVFQEFGQKGVQVLRAGNQSFLPTSQVLMADGSLKAIANIQAGDQVKVYSQKEKKFVNAPVLKLWNNGIHPVYRTHVSGGRYIDVTPCHEMITLRKSGVIIKTKAKDSKYFALESTMSNVKIINREFLGEFEVFDITVDHPDHNYVCDGFLCGNSGKTSVGARTCAWLLAETHPHWTRPKAFGKESLQIVVLGRNSKQIEESIYRRIKSYFPEGALKENRIGNIMQSVKHRTTGNTIIFQSYENENQARERVQSFSAHFVWIDEMPSTLALLTECLTRVQAKDGYLMATFTPLILSQEVRKWCDTLDKSAGSTHRFKMFDNPIYTPDRQAVILAKMESLPEHVRNARLYGEWIAADSAVYYWDEKLMMEDPRDYSPSWRHVESSDPAISSAHGLTVWAEDPGTGVWYLIRAEQLVGYKDNQGFLEEVLKRTKGLNIVKRIYDTASTSYAATAQRFGIHYTGVYHKVGRKIEMIQNFQASLGTKIRIASWCIQFVDQLTDCHWAENAEGKIVKSSKFHMLDSACYFVDCMPKGVIQSEPYNPLTAFRDAAVRQQRQEWERLALEEANKHNKLPNGRTGPLRVARRWSR